jgi:hypothetical protein
MTGSNVGSIGWVRGGVVDDAVRLAVEVANAKI